MPTPFEFRLLDNALDYVWSAAERAHDGGARNLKYAVLHLFAGIELLLKARLQREHWSLLFADVNKADQGGLSRGEFRSVDFDLTCQRLTKIAEVHVQPTDRVHLDKLRDLRNRLQHFGVQVGEDEVKSLVAAGANFAIDFCREHLPELFETHSGVVEQIRAHLAEFDEYVERRLAAIKPDLDDAPTVWGCPNCWQDALVIGDGDPHCLFCDFVGDPEAIAADVSETCRVVPCPHCRSSACTLRLRNNEEAYWACAGCGVELDADEYSSSCPRCECPLKAGDGICTECLGDLVARDTS